MKRLYLDHAATTPLRPEVLEEMMPYLTDLFGNPSSLHAFGRDSRVALDHARHRIARLLNCDPQEIAFTSGGTESDNTALFGTALAWRESSGARGHIITTSVEHHAVLHACRRLEELGFDVTYLPADELGQVNVQHFLSAIRDDTFLVSVMYGNNEVGTLQPIFEIGQAARERGIIVHTDAVQALGAVPVDLKRLPVDLLSASAHKINGPKGVGLLYHRRGVRWKPLLYGGSQERGHRAGTENVAGIVGFAKALQLVQEELSHKQDNMWELRRTFIQELSDRISSAHMTINGHPTATLPHIVNISFPGLSSDTLLMNLDLAGIAASSGSACSAGSLEVSHVLKAMGLSEDRLQSAVRFSFGYGTTVEAVREAAERIAAVVHRMLELVRS
jgi:cysteine desulfurase